MFCWEISREPSWLLSSEETSESLSSESDPLSEEESDFESELPDSFLSSSSSSDELE